MEEKQNLGLDKAQQNDDKETEEEPGPVNTENEMLFRITPDGSEKSSYP